MAKFDPEKITNRQTNTQTEAGEVARAIDKGTGSSRRAHTTVSKEVKAQREAEGRTQGAKGCRTKRMNISLKTDNYKIVAGEAGRYGVSYSRFLNTLIDAYRDANPEQCAQDIAAFDAIQEPQNIAFSKELIAAKLNPEGK